MRKLVAMVSNQGTACSETVLTEQEDTETMRARIEEQFCKGREDDPIKGSWTDVSENDACQAMFED